MINKLSKQRTTNRKRKGKGLGSGLGKQQVEGTKAKSLDLVLQLETLRVAKCLSIEKLQKEVLILSKN